MIVQKFRNMLSKGEKSQQASNYEKGRRRYLTWSGRLQAVKFPEAAASSDGHHEDGGHGDGHRDDEGQLLVERNR